MRAVPGDVPPSDSTESCPAPRNGAPFGSNKYAVALWVAESGSVTVAWSVAPAASTLRK